MLDGIAMVSVFLEKEFIELIVFSVATPVLVYFLIWHKRSISRATVVSFGIILIILAGLDIFLLRILSDMAKHSLSMLDNRLFSSELSVALYLLPALYAGTGINLISHILVTHLAKAEIKFDAEHGAL
jgi:indole-3-glycerol phosphate synthase